MVHYNIFDGENKMTLHDLRMVNNAGVVSNGTYRENGPHTYVCWVDFDKATSEMST